MVDLLPFCDTIAPLYNTKNGENAVAELKTLNIRLPKPLWAFLKKQALIQEISLNALIKECLEKYKKRVDGK